MIEIKIDKGTLYGAKIEGTSIELVADVATIAYAVYKGMIAHGAEEGKVSAHFFKEALIKSLEDIDSIIELEEKDDEKETSMEDVVNFDAFMKEIVKGKK